MPFVYGPRQTFLRYFQYDKKLTRDVKEKALESEKENLDQFDSENKSVEELLNTLVL